MHKTFFSAIRQEEARILIIGMHPALTQSILDFDKLCGKKRPSIVGIITNGRGSAKYFWGNEEVLIPCFRHVDEMKRQDRSELRFAIVVQSGRRAKKSTEVFFTECPKAQGAVIFAEGVPEKDSVDLIALYGEKVLLLGPASVGMLVGGHLKLGAIGGVTVKQLQAGQGWHEGQVAVVSTSGGMTNELMHTVIRSGQHISVALSIGGDRFPVASLHQVLALLEADAATKAILYFGELGGNDEYEIVELIQSKKLTKPFIAYIAGTIDEAFSEPQQFGHAKALARTQDESARAKREALRTVGAIVPETFAGLEEALRTVGLPETEAKEPAAWIRDQREPSLFTTRKLQALPKPVVERGKLVGEEQYELAQSVWKTLTGRRVRRETAALFDLAYRLLIDHGGNVSGAVNSMITARAGRDLATAVAAGLLTVGPRFGGAINDAARQWLYLREKQVSLNDFIEEKAKQGVPLPGIGHKKYRIGLPDPRVAILETFAELLTKTPCLDIARATEAITVRKSGSLILNVDGMLAALFLDMLAEKEGFTDEDLEDLITQEFFNALFIIPRVVGFIGHALEQKKNDEGLFRLPDHLLLTVDE